MSAQMPLGLGSSRDPWLLDEFLAVLKDQDALVCAMSRLAFIMKMKDGGEVGGGGNEGQRRWHWLQ